MYNIYLKEEDLLNAEQFPVAALINEAANSDIIEFVTNLVDGVGSGYNYSNCSFWNDFDEFEQANMKKFDGLWVGNEGGEEIIPQVEAIVKASIPVMGHIGLTPQSINAIGGYRAQGRDVDSAKKLLSKDEKTTLSNNSVDKTTMPQLLHTGAHNYKSSLSYDKAYAMSLIIGKMLSLSHKKI